MKILKLLIPVIILGLVLVGCGQKAGEVKLSTGSVVLKSKGATAKINATVYDTKGQPIANPKESFSWSSSDSKVATIDGAGNVKAVNTGNCTVTASYAGLTASATVKVQLVNSVTVVPGSASAKVGDSVKFKAVVKDGAGNVVNVPVTWSVGNGKVLKGSGGSFKAVSKGNTFVTATAGGKSGKASVSISEEGEVKKIGGFKKKAVKKVGGFKKK